jgi:AP-4 complex subunit beta-1
MLQTLSRVFDRIINSESPDIQLKDLAALYYRAMQSGMHSFKELYLTRREFISVAEEVLPQYQFNTLEVIYKQDKDTFTRDVKSFGRMYALEF